MNVIAIVAVLLVTPLVQSDGEVQGCKTALNELAVSAHAAVLATETADGLVAKVGELGTKLESCRKGRGRSAAGCAKLETSLRAAEAELIAAEDQLTFALESVDAAYDEFDAACSWDEPDTEVQVRHLRPRHEARRTQARSVAKSQARTTSRRR
ncbi:MAG: hypothetical protein HYU52_14855 [Acidobacteria bacterium]|nr:hypothetical protein [Acidobacteriota bacterium]